MAQTRQINMGDWLKIRKIATADPDDDVVDSPLLVFGLTDGIIEGTTSRDDIMDAVIDRRIKATTGAGLLEKLAVEGRQDTPFQATVKSHDYKLARDTIRRSVITTGPFGVMDPGEQERLSNAYIELDERIRRHLSEGNQTTPEWLTETHEDIRERYKSSFSSAILGLPLSNYINKPAAQVQAADVQKAQEGLFRAYQSKAIDLGTFNREASLLERYMQLLEKKE